MSTENSSASSAVEDTPKSGQVTKLEQTNPDYDPNVVVETQNLTKIYRDFWGRQKVRALNALDLEVRKGCLLYTSPSPRDKRQSRMPSSA